MRYLVGLDLEPQAIIASSVNRIRLATAVYPIASASWRVDQIVGVERRVPVAATGDLESIEVLREFMKRGADPNTVEDIPLLSAAALSNRAKSARVLIEAGANPELKDQYGWTPLMHATKGVDHDVNLTEAIVRAAIAKNNQPR